MKPHDKIAMPTATKNDVIGLLKVCLAEARKLIWNGLSLLSWIVKVMYSSNVTSEAKCRDWTFDSDCAIRNT